MAYTVITMNAEPRGTILSPVKALSVGGQFFYPGRVVVYSAWQIKKLESNPKELQAVGSNGNPFKSMHRAYLNQSLKPRKFTTDFARDDDTGAYGVLVTRIT